MLLTNYLFKLNLLSPLEKDTYIKNIFQMSLISILEAFRDSIFLLVFIKVFNGSSIEKGFLQSSFFIGQLLSIFLVSYIKENAKFSFFAGLVSLISAFFVFFSALFDSIYIYLISCSFASFFLSVKTPFLTGIYERNLDKRKRGRIIGDAFLIANLFRILLIFFIIKPLLDQNISNYKPIFIVNSFFILLGSIFIFTMKDAKIDANSKKRNIFENFGLLKKYPAFSCILVSWFILGFSNLMINPLRVEYLTSKKYNLNLSVDMVIIIVEIIPLFARLIFTRIWSILFDKLNFILLRLILNAFMSTGILLYFYTDNLNVIISGAILRAIAMAGAQFAWNLWVLKIAPEGESQNFMSVHVFFTGIRGFLTSFISFELIKHIPMRYIGLASFIGITVSSIILIPFFKMFKKAKS